MVVEKSPLSVGDTFNRLTIVGPSRKDSRSRRYYPVVCSCGINLEVRKDGLISGHTGSCGCLGKEKRLEAVRTHGMTGTFEYHVWENMIQRCTNPEASGFEKYGGVGISVCKAWIESFEQFYSDMGNAPNGYTLDRIDSTGNYEPSNCRWATKSVQSFNTKKRVDNSSGRTGVKWINSNQKWNAYIQKDGVHHNLGYFASFLDAVLVRRQAELDFFGFNLNEEI